MYYSKGTIMRVRRELRGWKHDAALEQIPVPVNAIGYVVSYLAGKATISNPVQGWSVHTAYENIQDIGIIEINHSHALITLSTEVTFEYRVKGGKVSNKRSDAFCQWFNDFKRIFDK